MLVAFSDKIPKFVCKHEEGLEPSTHLNCQPPLPPSNKDNGRKPKRFQRFDFNYNRVAQSAITMQTFQYNKNRVKFLILPKP